MGKIYVPDHDAFISFWMKPKKDDAKHGEIVPHQKVVSNVSFFDRRIVNGEEVFYKIEISKTKILDLAKKISEIQDEVIDLEFDDNPF